MSSDRQKKKGYPIPDPATTDDTICVSLRIPNDETHIANFIGHLNLLTKWNWHHKTYSGTDTRASEVARMWHELLEKWLCMNSCEESSIANDLSIITSTDTWYNNINNNYDGNPESVAPDMVYDSSPLDGNRNAALCYALQGYVDQLCTLAVEFIDDSAILTSSVSTALALLAGILAVPTFGLSLWMIIGMGIASLSLNILSTITIYGREIYEDAEARKQVACYLYSVLKDDTLEEADFEGALAAHTLTGNADKIAELVEPFMADTNQYLSFLMLTNQAFGLSKINALLPCPCDCQYTWAFEDDDELPHEILDGTRTTSAGRSGYGILGDPYTAGGGQNGVRSEVKLEVECTVYTVRLDLRFKHGSANNNIGVSVKAYTAGDVLINNQPPSGVLSKSKNTWHTVDIPIIAPDAAYIIVTVAFQNTIDPETDDKYVNLDNVKVNP